MVGGVVDGHARLWRSAVARLWRSAGAHGANSSNGASGASGGDWHGLSLPGALPAGAVTSVSVAAGTGGLVVVVDLPHSPSLWRLP